MNLKLTYYLHKIIIVKYWIIKKINLCVCVLQSNIITDLQPLLYICIREHSMDCSLGFTSDSFQKLSVTIFEERH